MVLWRDVLWCISHSFQDIISEDECRSSDVFLSYLPLAHIFDRVAEETFLALGGSIGYWQGNPKTLLDDVSALRPTIFVGVPRIFDRIYTGVTQKVCNCDKPL
jgi:long-chain acyl-CoA synthetase